MTRLTVRTLVDRQIPGGLRNFLLLARGNGDSYHAITIRMREEHGISVTSPTVRAWCIHYGIEKIEAAS